MCALYAFIGSLGFLLRTYQKYYVLISVIQIALRNQEHNQVISSCQVASLS